MAKQRDRWNYLGIHLRRDEAGVSLSDHRGAEWVKISGHITGKGPMMFLSFLITGFPMWKKKNISEALFEKNLV